jgi:hypothetical protein
MNGVDGPRQRGTATFYTVAEARFFAGAAALLNSLRLTGNDGELVVLDCGLLPEQRARLEPHATIIDPPQAVTQNPYLIKPFPSQLEPYGIVVIIDSDIIVTRSLQDIIALAGAGKICVFPEHAGTITRWVPEWEEVFALRRPLRRDHYRNAGFVALSLDYWPGFLERWWELAQHIPTDRTMHVGTEFIDPFWGADQDALNALLMSEIEPEAVFELPFLEAPREWWLRQVEVVDVRTLECRLDGVTPAVLHYTGKPKPWQQQAWMRVRARAFERLLKRLFFESDVLVPLQRTELPVWLRPGLRSLAILKALSVMNSTVRFFVHLTSGRLRDRFTKLRDRLSS